MSSHKKLAYVLGGGGARGIAHIGVLKELEKAGLRPDLVVGVSMGAIIGAAYALGRSASEIEAFALSLTSRQIAGFFSPGPMHRYLIRADKGFNYLDKHLLAEKSFADTVIPFKTLATDLSNGQEKILDKGQLIEALRASSSVPGIFPPVEINGHRYIDGGVINPTPIDLAREMGADLIIAVDFIANQPGEFKDANIISTLLQAYEIIRTDAVRHRMARAGGDIILIEPKMRGASDSFKFHKLKDFIASGQAAAAAVLPLILEKTNDK